MESLDLMTPHACELLGDLCRFDAFRGYFQAQTISDLDHRLHDRLVFFILHDVDDE